MYERIKERIIKEADLIINEDLTLRDVSKKLNISKSTVHIDMTKKLKYIDKTRYQKINKILNQHLETRHIKGGIVTKLKYKKS